MLPSVSVNDSDLEAIPKSSFSCRIGRSESNRGLTNSITVAEDSHSKWIVQPTRTVSILSAVADAIEEIGEQWEIERVALGMILHSDNIRIRPQSRMLDYIITL